MFQIKICGVKDLATAQACCAAGADAIGLNFYSKSKRFVAESDAAHIAKEMRGQVTRVGLFVNETPDFIANKLRTVELDVVQLHGDENVSFAIELAKAGLNLPILKAIRISPDTSAAAIQEIEAWSSSSLVDRVGGILLDANVKGSFGGTGERIDWQWLSQVELPTRLPVLLAGGLNPENVSDAVRIVRPFGVDVAGGVEAENGVKDDRLIQQFVSQARQSLDSNGSIDRD